MITGDLRNKIDKLWEEFWTGGIANPLQVIEQITFLLFARMLDITETKNEKREQRSGRPAPKIFSAADQDLRWHNWINLTASELLPFVRDKVFPHFRQLGGPGSQFAEYMKDAQLMVQKPSLLVSAVNRIEELPLERTDIKGDLYEYLLSKLSQAGVNGQFRTPRHIIRFMVELLAPEAADTIGDPACGTAGFLVSAAEYLQERYTSPEGVIHEGDGNAVFTGDRLTDENRLHRQRGQFHGFDFDVTMLRIAAMNLVLHGIEEPDIHYQDTLSTTFPDKFRLCSQDAFDVVLANPPFKGSLDYSDVQPALLAKVKTKKTELLFVALILRMLKLGGRSATIVPDGVLFGSSNAHQALRKALIEENQLDAVISLPSGVFKPYAGVSTAILCFTKGGRTNEVFFYDVGADGLSLDDKRDKVEANDLPDALERWRHRDPSRDTDRTAKAFFVTAKEIAENKYDLSLNRYKETVHEEEPYEPPLEILARMKGLELEILRDIEELEGMLS